MTARPTEKRSLEARKIHFAIEKGYRALSGRRAMRPLKEESEDPSAQPGFQRLEHPKRAGNTPPFHLGKREEKIHADGRRTSMAARVAGDQGAALPAELPPGPGSGPVRKKKKGELAAQVR